MTEENLKLQLMHAQDFVCPIPYQPRPPRQEPIRRSTGAGQRVRAGADQEIVASHWSTVCLRTRFPDVTPPVAVVAAGVPTPSSRPPFSAATFKLYPSIVVSRVQTPSSVFSPTSCQSSTTLKSVR
ncbi:hypothetical protein ACRE_062070 [Hapsidospora chrysogenum ATCC 11550]|uniref:Uncharacterized protein n=1 Tax=Hapsidospora chrysogenum (strain ATCC 11550 / CBS 779.69 / DSM 880 / IAM 14645 / JCM 23072 / IMI 49137) TaxID=857340 RepID=A0A086T0Y3_HAPC1|nr:hypothetical protein ACRE_062070 [Hapsidospora chrysogenum ATCC 11550]